MLICLFILLPQIALSEQGNFPKSNKQKLFNACYSLYKAQLSFEATQLEEFFGGFAEPEKAKSFYTAEVLIQCYSNIDLKTALKVNENEVSSEIYEKHSNLLKINKDLVKNSDLKATKRHMMLYEEIKLIKAKAENEYESTYAKGSKNLFSSSGFYILAAVLASFLVLYFIVKGLKSVCKRYRKKKYY